MSEDLTLYDVLGVESTADKDAIKAAYQTRLSEVQGDVAREQGAKKPDQGSIDGYRREEASIRGAWQVLSDPYQRGRYDATMELGGDRDVEIVDDVDDGAPVPPSPAARGQAVDRRGRPIRERPPSIFSAEPLPTPASWPPGVQPPPSRARTIAMGIDILVLMFLYIGLSLLGQSLLDDKYPRVTRQMDLVTECSRRIDVAKDRDPLSISQIQRVEDYCSNRATVDLASASKREKLTKEERLDDVAERANDRYADLRGKTQGFATIVMLGTLFILGLYLIPASAITGRTLGKKLMQIRAVNIDGSPLGFRGAFVRYGLPLLVTMTVLGILGPIGFAIALFGVVTWPRNPNVQGMHDRMAKTIVVDG